MGKVRGVQTKVNDGFSVTSSTTTTTTLPEIGEAHDPEMFISSIGMKTYSSLNKTMSNLTGIDIDNTEVKAAFNELKSSLPNSNQLQKYNASTQKAVALLAATYCDELVKGPAAGLTTIVPGISMNSLDPEAVAEGFVRNFWGVEAEEFQNDAIKEFGDTNKEIISTAGLTNRIKFEKVVFSTCLGTLSSLPIWIL